VVRESGDWVDDGDCGCHHGPSPFRDFHLELLLATLSLPIFVVNIVNNVYGIAFHGLCIASPDLFTARANRLVVVTLGKREAGGVRLFAGRTQ